MRHWHLGLLLFAAGCNSAGYEAVAIRPTFGWADGCTAVKISGHGFGDEVSATVGGNAVEDITRAEAEEDQQFFFFGTMPAGDPGAQDLVVTSDGKESTVEAAFYYVACTGPATLETVTPNDGVAAGATVSLAGCGFDVATQQVRIIDPTGTVASTTASLTADCGTAYASFTAPTMPDGDYWVFIEDIASGDVLNPVTGDPRECALDTAADCAAPRTITYGGAE